MLMWDQLREMDAAGFSAGAHTKSHPLLSRLPREGVRDELSSGKEALEARVGRPVETFAYPNGKRDDYDEEVMSEVRACGFELACTALFGSNTPAVDPYELRSQPLRYDARRGRAPNRGFLLPSVTRRPAR